MIPGDGSGPARDEKHRARACRVSGLGCVGFKVYAGFGFRVSV